MLARCESRRPLPFRKRRLIAVARYGKFGLGIELVGTSE